MGRRGPLPTKDGRKVPRSTNIVQLQAVPGGRLALPVADVGWLDSTKLAWDDYRNSGLVEVVIQADLWSILDLFRMRDRLTRYEETIEADGPTYDFHNSEARLHPLTMECHRLRTAIRELEARLGILPKPREQLKIAVGQATLTADEINRRTRQRDTSKPTQSDKLLEAEFTEA